MFQEIGSPFGVFQPEVVVPLCSTVVSFKVELSEGFQKVRVTCLSGPTDALLGLLIDVVVPAGNDLQRTALDVDFFSAESSEVRILRWADVFE